MSKERGGTVVVSSFCFGGPMWRKEGHKWKEPSRPESHSRKSLNAILDGGGRDAYFLKIKLRTGEQVEGGGQVGGLE